MSLVFVITRTTFWLPDKNIAICFEQKLTSHFDNMYICKLFIKRDSIAMASLDHTSANIQSLEYITIYIEINCNNVCESANIVHMNRDNVRSQRRK